MQGYAECYMENFAPWVKSHGGWVSGDYCTVKKKLKNIQQKKKKRKLTNKHLSDTDRM